MSHSIPTGYKPSPLGPIPQDWDVLELKNIFDFKQGIQCGVEEQQYEHKIGFVNFVRIINVTSDPNDIRYIPDPGEIHHINIDDLFMVRYGDAGKVVKGFQGVIANNMFRLIPRISISKKWAYQQLIYFYRQLHDLAGSSTMPALSFEKLNKFKLPLPPLPEQQAIASILSTCDESITTTQALIDRLQRRHKALCQQLLTGKKRVQGFGEKWGMVKLGDVFERVTRKNEEKDTNVLTISAQRGLINQENYFNKQVASEILDNYFLLYRDEFAYNKSYSNGYPMGAVKRLKYYDKGVVTTLYICFRLKVGNIEFFEHYFDAQLLVKGLEKIAHEGGRAHGLLNVTPSDFFELQITIPSPEEQTAIASILNASQTQIDLAQTKLSKLKQHKQGLMQQLLTGKTRIPSEMIF